MLTLQTTPTQQHTRRDKPRPPLAGLNIEVWLVELLVVEAVPSTLHVRLLCPLIVEVTVTHCALEGGMGELGVVGHRNDKLLTYMGSKEGTGRGVARERGLLLAGSSSNSDSFTH